MLPFFICLILSDLPLRLRSGHELVTDFTNLERLLGRELWCWLSVVEVSIPTLDFSPTHHMQATIPLFH